MNERIKELWLQAAREDSGDTWDSQTQFIERFALLVVRECINQALEEKVSEEEIDKENDIEDRCYLRGNNGGIVDAVIKIKQHFGVEND